jgi:hypothetical protein
MWTFRLWSLVGVLLVSLSAVGAAASPSLRPAAAPDECLFIQSRTGDLCEWVAAPRRFAYCKYSVATGNNDGMLCVSPVSGSWVRMAVFCCFFDPGFSARPPHGSYGRDPDFVGFRRRAEIVRGDWFPDRPSNSKAYCRANVRFFFCALSGEIAVWFKPDGSFALLRRTKAGWKLEARG